MGLDMFERDARAEAKAAIATWCAAIVGARVYTKA